MRRKRIKKEVKLLSVMSIIANHRSEVGDAPNIIRYFGSYPEGVSYGILIMNLCTWAIDKAFCRPQFGVTKEDLAAAKAAKKAAKEGA